MSDFYAFVNATGITLSLAFFSLLAGLILALLFTAWEACRCRSFALSGTTFITLIRGLPELLVVLLVYFGSSQLFLTLSDGFTLNFGFFTLPIQWETENQGFSPFMCGVIALAILYAAYASQTLRGALKAVPAGQWEAGRALGMKTLPLFFLVILPQMWRHALPGLGNQWLVLLKDTALVSLISVNDIMLQAKSIATRTQEPFTWYFIAAVIYLIVTLLSQRILTSIKIRATHYERNEPS